MCSLVCLLTGGLTVLCHALFFHYVADWCSICTLLSCCLVLTVFSGVFSDVLPTGCSICIQVCCLLMFNVVFGVFVDWCSVHSLAFCRRSRSSHW